MNSGLKSHPVTVLWTLLWVVVAFAYIIGGGLS